MGLALAALLAQGAWAASYRFVYDPTPAAGLPAAARATAGDTVDQGPLGDVVVPRRLHSVVIRWYDPKRFAGLPEVEVFLVGLLSAKSGETATLPRWAEALGVPVAVAELVFKDGKVGHWRVWPYRSAYQGPDLGWWFTNWGKDDAQLFEPKPVP
ncbi:MAG: hypothetical protein HYV15_02620 [Elusimicrobia bacterium]|nr:hypothetical protein [Elusimicrobiota bacterium]